MTNIIDDLQLESDNNANELSHDQNGKYIPMDDNYVSKLDDEIKNNADSFEAISNNIKRVKRRMQGVLETPKPEPTEKKERILTGEPPDLRKRRLDNFEPTGSSGTESSCSGAMSYNALGIFLRCNSPGIRR